MSDLTAPPARRLRVAMLVRNAMTQDSRVEREARSLVAAGHSVTVVCHAAPDLPANEARDGYAIRRVARTVTSIPGLRYLAYGRRLRDELLASEPDVLQAHDTDALEAVGEAARRAGIPYVYDAHELWLARPRRGRSRLYHWLSNAWYGRVERRLIPNAAAVIVANPPVGPALTERYGILAPAPVPNYPDPAEIGPCQELRLLPGAEAVDARPIVLYIGGVMADRGIEALVQAVTTITGVQLVFLGDGPHLPVIRALAEQLGIANRVHVVPPVPPAQVIGVAASATIGVSVLPPTNLNNAYALPNKLFQSMAAGLPTVASDFPQVRDVLVGSEAGLVVDTSRPGAIAAALRTLLADPALAQRMGANARRAIEGRYNWAVSAATLTGIYARIGGAAGEPAGAATAVRANG